MLAILAIDRTAMYLAILGLALLWLAFYCLRLRRTNKTLETQLKLAREDYVHARYDFLTGLLNRRGLDEVVRESLIQFQRQVDTGSEPEHYLTIAMLDLDQFKQINDRYGHLGGDQALVEFSKRLLSKFTNQTGDCVARIGGEEFLVLSRSSTNALNIRMDQFVQSLSLDPIRIFDDAVPLSSSVGVAGFIPHESLETWMYRADQALYKAKQQGGNRVLVAG